MSDIIDASRIRATAIIPARGGSKRLKRKNIYPIWGKPMIYWSIQAAKNSDYITDIWVSTEDDEIAQVALDQGVKVHMRPKHLSKDDVYKMAAIRSCYNQLDSRLNRDIIISLQANSPEITAEHLDGAIDFFIEHDRNEVMSVGCNLIQNAAFRIMKPWYVNQLELSTKSGVYVCDVHDVHTKKDIHFIENRTFRSV